MIGKTISHYRILEKLGEGGMGVVYKARDSHLDRFVALKILPAEKVADPDRKRRFAQEAKAASSLNHPHIVTIHDIDEADGIHFIAMEYVEGRTLDQLIPRHGMRLNEALKVAVPIADALAAAHEAGIVHRDLKPGNLIVTEKGQVKVLDFGLAKLTEKVLPGAEDATLTAKLGTEENQIVGTVAYMSPEQAEGRKVDARSDIFSFGSVLYEMLTGQKPFQGDSKLSIMTAILREDPKPAAQIVKGLPQEAERIIARCLRKDPARRFQHMDDLKVALEELKEESDSGVLIATPAPRRSHRPVLAVVAVVMTLLLAVGFSAWFLGIRSRKPEVSLTAVRLTTYPGDELYPTFSPDGNQVAFCWNGEKQDNYDIYVKLIGPGEPLRLTTNPAQDYSPAWSPDGRSIAFLRYQTGEDPAVILVPALGGAERKLSIMHLPPQLDLPYGVSHDLAWSPDGQWLAFPDTRSDNEQIGMFLFSVETGEERRLTQPPANFTDANPAFAPDGRALAFIRSSGIGSEIFLLGLSEKMTPNGEPRQLTFETQTILCPVWTSDGLELLFSLGQLFRTNLWRIPAVGSGKPQRLASVGEEGFLPSISRHSHRLTYVRSSSDWNIWRLEISGLSGKQNPAANFIHSTQMEYEPQYSPDGKKIVFVSNRSGNDEIWACNRDGTNPVQITSLGGPHNGAPRWSPDGEQITFDSYVAGSSDIYVVSAEGGKAKRLTENPASDFFSSWSRDGKWVYFTSNRSGMDQIWKMRANGGEAVQVTKKGSVVPFESPDGKWLYYTKQAGARTELWKLALEDDEEKRVVDNFAGGPTFALGTQGIYFMSALQPNGETDLQFLSFADSKIKTIDRIEKPVLSLTLSPDGRYLLYDRADQQGSDLMLVENFR